MSPRKKALIIGSIIAACLLLVFGYLYYERRQAANVSRDDRRDLTRKKKSVVSVKAGKGGKTADFQRMFPRSERSRPLESVERFQSSISAQITQMRLLKNQYVKQGEVISPFSLRRICRRKKMKRIAALEEARLNLQMLQKVTIPQTIRRKIAEGFVGCESELRQRPRNLRRDGKDLYEKGGLVAQRIGSVTACFAKRRQRLKARAEKYEFECNSAVNPNSHKPSRNRKSNRLKRALIRLTCRKIRRRCARRFRVSSPTSFNTKANLPLRARNLLTIANVGEVIVKANFADTVVG